MQHGQRVSSLFDIGKAKRTKGPANAVQGVVTVVDQPGDRLHCRFNLVAAHLGQMSEIKAGGMLHLAGLKIDNLQTAAPQISDKTGGMRQVQGQSTRYVMRLIGLRQHGNRLAKDLAGGHGEICGIDSTAHSGSRHSMRLHHTHAFHDAGKARQRIKRHGNTLFLQHAVRTQPFTKTAI